jgi:hypothetical protein
VHLPFLLRLASGAIDACAETLESTNSDGEEEMDVEDDQFEPTPEEVAQEAARLPLLAKNAIRWDEMLQWCRDIETPWAEDTLEYRKHRAVQYCNGARAVSRSLRELKPTLLGIMGAAHRVQHRSTSDCRSRRPQPPRRRRLRVLWRLL